ncbi:hypothetical protein F5Y03DRAFT_242160 [Xylaria venustula]|nr:hypothetical protein F5Y03DRAFT_242160 [Xylaria venustula]
MHEADCLDYFLIPLSLSLNILIFNYFFFLLDFLIPPLLVICTAYSFNHSITLMHPRTENAAICHHVALNTRGAVGPSYHVLRAVSPYMCYFNVCALVDTTDRQPSHPLNAHAPWAFTVTQGYDDRTCIQTGFYCTRCRFFRGEDLQDRHVIRKPTLLCKQL